MESQKSIHWEDFSLKSIPKSALDLFSTKKTESEQKEIDDLKLAAYLGDDESQFFLGVLYEKEGTAKSYQEAFRCYELAANQGDEDAQLSLSMLYEKGLGVEQSYEKAFYYCKLSADQGNSLALTHLGKFYIEGLGCEKSIEEGLKYYHLAAENGDVFAFEYLAEFYERCNGGEKSKEKSEYYKKKKFLYCEAHSSEGPDSLIHLGWCYEKGVGISPSPEKALSYYKLAADQNDPEGQYRLALCYEYGIGVEKSEDMAARYYRLAADQKHPQALFFFAEYLIKMKKEYELAISYLKELIQKGRYCQKNLLVNAEDLLGSCFEHGYGVDQSNKNAIYYYSVAAEGGHRWAQERLGKAYLKGELGLLPSLEKACYYYKLISNRRLNLGVAYLSFPELTIVANLGFPEAQYSVGDFYEYGKGIHQSYPDAACYYQLAAAQGHARAQLSLSMLYEEGLGVEQSYEKAFYYCKQAVDQGHLGALVQLGILYVNGLGIEKSIEQGLDCFLRAEQKGSISVMGELVKVYQEGIGVEKSQIKADHYLKKIFLHYKNCSEDSNDLYCLAQCYEEGKGIEKSVKIAFYYYQLAAKQNHLGGLSKLARFYEYGIGIEKSEEMATHYYKLAADHGNSRHLYSLARYLIDIKKENQRAVDCLKTIIQKERSCPQDTLNRSRRLLAECFEYGYGIEQSNQDAVFYYTLAAENGNNWAQDHLGKAYLDGELGLTPLPEKAFHYYKLSSNYGIQNELGVALMGIASCYEKGVGIEKSEEKAFYYYNLAANMDIKKDVGTCIGDLARCYEMGIGTEKSEQKAFYYYNLAAVLNRKNGSWIATSELGRCYENGMGTTKSIENAFKCYELAAENGVYSAKLRLGEAYLNGELDLLPSPEKGFYYYQLAAIDAISKGYHSCSIVKLAQCFENGIGTAKSPEMAYQYYKLAMEKGDFISIFSLYSCYLNGFGTEKSFSKALEFAKLFINRPEMLHLSDFYASNDYEQSCTEAFFPIQQAADQGDAESQSFIEEFKSRMEIFKRNFK